MVGTMATAFQEIEAIVSGQVQGVGFRDFAQTVAGELALTGFVENMSKGTVRAVAQGTPEALRAFVARLNEGSALARVADVSVSWRDPSAHFDDFSVRFR